MQTRRWRHGQCFRTSHRRQLLASLHQSIEIEFVRVTLSSNFAHYVLIVIVSKEKSHLFESLKDEKVLCFSNTLGPDWACRSSCWVWLCDFPIGVQLHQDRVTWIHLGFPPMRSRQRLIADRPATRAGTTPRLMKFYLLTNYFPFKIAYLPQLNLAWCRSRIRILSRFAAFFIKIGRIWRPFFPAGNSQGSVEEILNPPRRMRTTRRRCVNTWSTGRERWFIRWMRERHDTRLLSLLNWLRLNPDRFQDLCTLS